MAAILEGPVDQLGQRSTAEARPGPQIGELPCSLVTNDFLLGPQMVPVRSPRQQSARATNGLVAKDPYQRVGAGPLAFEQSEERKARITMTAVGRSA